MTCVIGFPRNPGIGKTGSNGVFPFTAREVRIVPGVAARGSGAHTSPVPTMGVNTVVEMDKAIVPVSKLKYAACVKLAVMLLVEAAVMIRNCPFKKVD